MTMGSYEGAEICLWTGLNLYITRLGTIIKKRDYWLYRLFFLDILRNVNGQQIDPTLKNVIKVFKNVGFSIYEEINSEFVG